MWMCACVHACNVNECFGAYLYDTFRYVFRQAANQKLCEKLNCIAQKSSLNKIQIQICYWYRENSRSKSKAKIFPNYFLLKNLILYTHTLKQQIFFSSSFYSFFFVSFVCLFVLFQNIRVQFFFSFFLFSYFKLDVKKSFEISLSTKKQKQQPTIQRYWCKYLFNGQESVRPHINYL